MFGTLDRSWHLTKLSFAVIREDKELLAFPLIAGVLSLLFTVAMVVPTAVGQIVFEDANEVVVGAVEYVVIFLVYAALAFLTTFSNVCVVYTTKTRFEGGNATFGESLAFAISKLHLILAWSLVSATVGVLLYAIDSIGERAGVVGRIIVSVVVSVLGATWSVITLFVVPAMVYEDVGPIDAIRRSTETLSRTWGESLARHFGLGIFHSLAAFAGVAVAVPLFMLAAGSSTALIAVGAVLVVYQILLALVFAVANTVFNTALYVYATTGDTPGGFDEQLLHATFYTRR